MRNNKFTIKRSEEAVWRIIDGDIVVLLPDDGMLHALGGCGTRVWELIEEETAFSQVLETICKEYDVEPTMAQADILEFINNLKSLNLVETTSDKSEESA